MIEPIIFPVIIEEEELAEAFPKMPNITRPGARKTTKLSVAELSPIPRVWAKARTKTVIKSKFEMIGARTVCGATFQNRLTSLI